jgi:hypothetical protein
MSEHTKNIGDLVGALFFTASGFTVVGFMIHHQVARRSWPRVTAKVSRFKSSHDPEGGTMLQAVAVFEVAGEEDPYEVTDKFSTNHPYHRVGDLVSLRYPPGEIRKAEFTHPVGGWLIMLPFLGIGIAGIYLALQWMSR